MILEKAYAKLYGSYANIESGWPLLAFRDLTGAPGTKLDINNESKPAETFKWIYDNFRKGFVQAAGTPSDGSGQNTVNQVGIVYSHAYSILNVFEVQGAKLLKLRNPWGS